MTYAPHVQGQSKVHAWKSMHRKIRPPKRSCTWTDMSVHRHVRACRRDRTETSYTEVPQYRSPVWPPPEGETRFYNRLGDYNRRDYTRRKAERSSKPEVYGAFIFACERSKREIPCQPKSARRSIGVVVPGLSAVPDAGFRCVRSRLIELGLLARSSGTLSAPLSCSAARTRCEVLPLQSERRAWNRHSTFRLFTQHPSSRYLVRVCRWLRRLLSGEGGRREPSSVYGQILCNARFESKFRLILLSYIFLKVSFFSSSSFENDGAEKLDVKLWRVGMYRRSHSPPVETGCTGEKKSERAYFIIWNYKSLA